MAVDTQLIIYIAAGVFLLSGIIVTVYLFLSKKQEQKVQNPVQQNSGATVSSGKNLQPLQEDKPIFQIDQPTIPSLPDFKDPKLVNVRYPLIPPYTFARVSWDSKENELTYNIEEPVLTDKEKDLLKTLEDGVRELINLSFISVKDKNTVLVYLEKNIRVLLTELAIDLPTDSFLKIMYYIYRDFVGLNELEPLMNDYFF